MCVARYARRKYTIIKTDVPGISLKSIFRFVFFIFLFLKATTDVLNFLSLFFHTLLLSLFPIFVSERPVSKNIYLYVHYNNVLCRCSVWLFRNAPFFSQRAKSTKPLKDDDRTLFPWKQFSFFFHFIFYGCEKNDNT